MHFYALSETMPTLASAAIGRTCKFIILKNPWKESVINYWDRLKKTNSLVESMTLIIAAIWPSIVSTKRESRTTLSGAVAASAEYVVTALVDLAREWVLQYGTKMKKKWEVLRKYGIRVSEICSQMQIPTLQTFQPRLLGNRKQCSWLPPLWSTFVILSTRRKTITTDVYL